MKRKISISGWIFRLLYLNILWLIFVLGGLIIFGFFPATASVFAVIGEWLKDEHSESTLSTFWGFYRSKFLKSNFIGLILFTAGYVLYIDFYFFIGQQGILNQVLYNLIIILIILYLIVLLYVFPVFASFDLGTFEILKNALLVGYNSPVKTLFTLIGLIFLLTFLFYLFPPFILLFLSSIALFLSWSANRVFNRIEDLRSF